MSALDDYPLQKRVALQWVKQEVAAARYRPQPIQAHVTAEGRSGIRRIRIRDFQVISDSPTNFAGYDLGPSSPELALGALGSCFAHSWLIQAAAQNVLVDSIEVEVTGQLDSRGSLLGREGVPVYPQALTVTVRISSPASEDKIAELHRAVDRACPVLNLLRRPQQIEIQIAHTVSATRGSAATAPRSARRSRSRGAASDPASARGDGTAHRRPARQRPRAYAGGWRSGRAPLPPRVERVCAQLEPRAVHKQVPELGPAVGTDAGP